MIFITESKNSYQFLNVQVPRYFDEDTSTNFWDELVADMLQD